MKKLSCKNLGPTDCDYSVEGSSVEEVARRMMDHAEKSHQNLLAGKADVDRENLLFRMQNQVRETL